MYRLGALVFTALLLALRPASGAAQDERDWQWRGDVDRGDAVEIKGVNGAIHAERASGGEVEVRAELRGRRDDPETVEMVVLQHENGVTICAVYPSEDEDRPNECLPGEHGRMNVRKNDVEVEFFVRVPAGVGLTARTVNGDVDATGIDGDVKVGTVNGSVDLSTTGLAEASTVNGSVTVSMQKADWTGSLDFTTVNGGVTLELPQTLSCEVSISTVNGHVSSDFPLTVEGRFSPRHLKGTIGSGGRMLVVKTVNGSIQLRRS
jgi:hypothetical protein